MRDDHDGPGYPWPAGSATGIGSMPGTSPAEAMRVVAGELPDFPYLPELPDRGPGADLTGKSASSAIKRGAEQELSQRPVPVGLKRLQHSPLCANASPGG